MASEQSAEVNTADRMIERPARKLSVWTYRMVGPLLLILAVFVGIAFSFVSRPAYHTTVSRPVGPKHTRIAVAYPGEWSATESDYSHANAESPVASIMLRRSPPVGLQMWIDGHIFHVTDNDWVNSNIRVELQKVPSFNGLNSEIARLQPFVRQMGRAGVKYTFVKTICPAGPVLEIRYGIPNTFQWMVPASGEFLVFPNSAPGEQQYEMIVGYSTSEPLKERMRLAAADIVSRIRLVRNNGEARLLSASRANGTENDPR